MRLSGNCLLPQPEGGPASDRPNAVSFALRDFAMIYISVHQSESIDQALKRFNLKIQQSGLLRELKDHSHYEKPSEKRRKAQRRRPQRG